MVISTDFCEFCTCIHRLGGRIVPSVGSPVGKWKQTFPVMQEDEASIEIENWLVAQAAGREVRRNRRFIPGLAGDAKFGGRRSSGSGWSSDRGSLLETGGISGLSAEALSGGRQRATRARQQETWSGEAFGDASRRKLRTRHPEEEADRSPVRGTRSWKTLREECFWRFAAETSSSDLGSGGDFRAGDAAEQPAEDYIVRLCRWCLI